MDIETKRLIVDFNAIIARLNNAVRYWEKCDNKQYEESLKLYDELINEASKIAIKLEKKLGRKITDYESLNGIEI